MAYDLSVDEERLQLTKINPDATHWWVVTTVDEAITDDDMPASLPKGRRAKFTPQAIEKIKGLVAQGVSLEEIAK